MSSRAHAPRSVLVLLALVASALTWTTGAHAQGSSVAPYFLVILDNSGSMDTSTGSGNNSCGQPRTRMNDARCVLSQVVNAYGDANFGLMRYAETCSTTSCSSGSGCTVTDCNGCGNSGSGCPATGSTEAQGQLLVPIVPDNQASIIQWADFTCTTGWDAVGAGANPELRPTTWTPIAGSMRGARRYYEGRYPGFASPITSDPFRACRPIHVILLTDGEETCASDAATLAAIDELRVADMDGAAGSVTFDIRSYIIGFGISAGNAYIESFASHGGTDAPGANLGFYAADETSLALAFSQIMSDAIRIEICDGGDNDCDTRIDEGFPLYCNLPSNPLRNLCSPPAETLCDNIDNNCNGTVDEGLRNACGTCGAAPMELCNRLDEDCDGIIDEGVCGGCVPSVEICNNMDDDCDMVVDNITRVCGTDVGECVSGTQLCTAGVFGACTGTGPRPELCNNLDDDCDGAIDGNVQMCGTDVGECQAGSQICMAGVLGPCIGAISMTAERCDTLDNDCDSRVDEMNPGGGGACGSSVGACTAGTLMCVAGGLTCTGGTSGGAETCNTLDDDCDGRVDEGDPGGGASCGTSSVGICRLGSIRCVAGMLSCTGAVSPGVELCNGFDDDCDGSVDEGNPESGARCGDDTGECMSGTSMCVSGVLMCVGAVGPTMEVCNALDDDCNGVIDDGIPVGAACGNDVGECDPGVFVCDTASGMLICSGELGPTTELCDLLDNDCDGAVDESMGAGMACGSDVGECMAGNEQCIGGALVCVGEAPPSTEICDCGDNDCDGMTDEPPPSGGLCPMGSDCVSCQCAATCQRTEFGFECPEGTTALVESDRTTCHCVAPNCDDATCAGETRTATDGTVQCAPGSDDVGACICRNNSCTFNCDGVSCMAAGLVCDPRGNAGTCVEDSCRGLGCPRGQLCDTVTGACEADPCASVTCAPTQACRAGVCEGTCAAVMCATGEVCRSGVCETDECVGVTCSAGQVCDPADGMCVANMCGGVRCPGTQTCNPVTGLCEADRCDGVTCPTGLACESGECVTPSTEPDAGVVRRDAGSNPDIDGGTVRPGDEHHRVLASGGGGCICSAVGASDRGASAGTLAFLAVLGVVLGRRRRLPSSARGEGGVR